MDSKILSKIRRQIDLDAARNEEFAAYDDMDAMRWTAPESLTREDWMRKYVDSSAHDALKTACDIFNTHRPRWEILPRGEGDRQNADNQERWLEWQMLRANQRGGTEPFREVLEHAVKYGIVAGRLDYLPYWLPQNKEAYTPEQKAAIADGAYCVILYNPSVVHFSAGKYGLSWAACVENILASDAAEYWTTYSGDSGEDARMIKAAVNKLQKMAEDDDEARVLLVDYTDHRRRSVIAVPVMTETVYSSAVLENADEAIDIFDGDNKLDFIPWVIVQGRDDPLLAPLHRGNIWENVNIWKTAANSAVLGRLFYPILNLSSMTGKDDVVIDFTGGTPIIKTKQGETIQSLSAPPVDPGVREMFDRASADLAQATGLQNFSGASVKSNVQFATLNAFLQVQKTRLEPAKRLAELFMAKLGRMAFMWVKQTGEAPLSYTKKADKDRGMVYEQIQLSANDFDPDTLFVSCEFSDNTPTDEQQRLNMFATAKQYGLPITDAFVMERMNWGNPESMLADSETEQIRKAALQAEIRRIMGEADVDVQARLTQMQTQMQMQMQAQQAQVQAAAASQPAQAGEETPPSFAPTGGVGFAVGDGGESPMMANPTMTQTQINPDEVVPA